MEITFYRKLANKVADAVIENQSYTEAEIKRIRHGLVCIFSDLYKFIIFLIIFYIFSLTKEFFVAFLGAMLLRPFLGGFHAKNELTCIFISFFTLLISISLGRINILPIYLQVIFIILFPIIGLIISPVRINKVETGEIKFKLITFIITVVILLLEFYFVPNQTLFWIIITIYIFAIFQFIRNIYWKYHTN